MTDLEDHAHSAFTKLLQQEIRTQDQRSRLAVDQLPHLIGGQPATLNQFLRESLGIGVRRRTAGDFPQLLRI